jgi:hypothetical protein
MSDMTEEEFLTIETAANALRGMTMDPSIPNHAKQVMRNLIAELEALVEEQDEDDEPDPDRLRDDRDERRRLEAEDE